MQSMINPGTVNKMTQPDFKSPNKQKTNTLSQELVHETVIMFPNANEIETSHFTPHSVNFIP